MIFHFTESYLTRKSFKQIILNGIKVIVTCIVLVHFSFIFSSRAFSHDSVEVQDTKYCQ